MATPVGHRNHQPRRHVQAIAGKAVDVEAHDAGDVLAEIVAALAAGLAGAAGQRAVHHHRIAELEAGHAVADRGDLARGLGADHQRQLALGKRHAAEAPDVDMVERDRLDRDLHLARPRAAAAAACSRSSSLRSRDERERADGRGHAGSRPITSDTFWPPKPNELEMTCRTLASRASFGTTSSGIAGSGTV